MSRGLIFSFLFHTFVIFITALTLPFMMREPIDVPPIVSVELIQIKDKTFIPYAPKARKIIEKVKEDTKRVVSEQAPPSAKAKEKTDRIPLILYIWTPIIALSFFELGSIVIRPYSPNNEFIYFLAAPDNVSPERYASLKNSGIEMF